MKNNITKSIKYLLLFTLAGTLFLFYLLPLSLYAPTFGKAISFYGEIYLSILSGAFSVWWTFSNESILFKIVTTVIGILCLAIWSYMIKRETRPFWKLTIPLVIWVCIGWFFIFAEITAGV